MQEIVLVLILVAVAILDLVTIHALKTRQVQVLTDYRRTKVSIHDRFQEDRSEVQALDKTCRELEAELEALQHLALARAGSATVPGSADASAERWLLRTGRLTTEQCTKARQVMTGATTAPNLLQACVVLGFITEACIHEARRAASA